VGARLQLYIKKKGPGRMAETNQAGTSSEEVDVIGAQLCSHARAIFPS